jgi:hypothetical protein
LDADRKALSAGAFSGYKNRQIGRVHARICHPFENASAFLRGITNTPLFRFVRKERRICFLNFQLFANPKSKI